MMKLISVVLFTFILTAFNAHAMFFDGMGLKLKINDEVVTRTGTRGYIAGFILQKTQSDNTQSDVSLSDSGHPFSHSSSLPFQNIYQICLRKSVFSNIPILNRWADEDSWIESLTGTFEDVFKLVPKYGSIRVGDWIQIEWTFLDPIDFLEKGIFSRLLEARAGIGYRVGPHVLRVQVEEIHSDGIAQVQIEGRREWVQLSNVVSHP